MAQPKPTLFQRAVNRVFGPEIDRRVSLAVKAVDDETDRQMRGSKSTAGDRDRYDYDRDQVLRDALQAWRVNPLARRIVSLTTQYVVGAGVKLECKHEATREFLQKWWNHHLNRMPTRVFEWCDELTRSGELFIVISTDQGGMSYVRAVPAHDIDEIVTRDNDVEQAAAFVEKPMLGQAGSEPRTWPAYDPRNDTPPEQGNWPPVMLHFAINRPVGAKHGESDLAPLLRWLSRYAGWLEDRARLNHWRQIFLYIVTGKYPDETAKKRRQSELNANPPSPGSILVADESETWDVIAPKLDSFEAREDGLAVKKMVAAGAALPLHFLAEPESSTRTTAESSGGPTFRHYQQRQIFVLHMLHTIADIVVDRRQKYNDEVSKKAEITATGADISAKDNAALAAAAVRIITAFGQMYDRGLIDEAEFLRMAYTFAGEVVDVDALVKRVVPPRAPVATGKPLADPDNDPAGKEADPGDSAQADQEPE